MRKVVDSELGFVADGPCGKSEAKVSKGNTLKRLDLLCVNYSGFANVKS